MLFAIQNAHYDCPLGDYPVLSEKYGAHRNVFNVDDPWYEHALIEIDCLEQLLQLSKDTGKSIVVNRDKLAGHPWLMIYDDYLE